jgi:hypothetical protein
MNPFSLFSRKVCLTLGGPEWPIAQAEFERVGLDGVLRFDALPIDEKEILGPHQSFNGSVRKILIEALDADTHNLLFLEDDCTFRPLDHLEAALSELPVDWDIIYLGANLICWNSDEPQPVRYSEHLFRIGAAWTTHAIGFNRRVIPFILENQPGLSDQMIDNWISSQLPELNAYCVAPMVAYQRPRVSAIWQRFDDYTPIFEASDERLR